MDPSGRTVPLRICTPTSTTVRGVYLDIPGGGFYLGPTAGGDLRNAALAESLGIAVVGVDYRLAPQHPRAAAPDDCEAPAPRLLAPPGARLRTPAPALRGS